ncbi:MAG: PKD domain-containing protein [Campylobacterota bacterium]|nr:PKD domain-containing protein [Campylobacterota bacterium]
MKIMLNALLTFFLIFMFTSCGSDTLDKVGNPSDPNDEIPNTPPVANAGVDQNSTVNIVVNLDGSLSSDVDANDTLTYNWSIFSKVQGSTAEILNPTTITPSFTPDMVGTYQIQLTVSDGHDGHENSDTVTIIATEVPVAPVAPVANAGVDQNVNTLASVTLDASGSSAEGGVVLSYSWNMRDKPTGSVAQLSADNIVNLTFTADMDGDYIIDLVVNDGTLDSNLDTVIVHAATPNSAPVANAGDNQNSVVLTRITLDGSQSNDADGDMITYSWTAISIPDNSTVTLSSTTVSKPYFTPDIVGQYEFSLIVNDGQVNSAADSVLITATESNAAPIAVAGYVRPALKFSTVTLDGSASSDADGDTLTYSWNFIAKPSESNATLSNKTVVNPQFYADVPGGYELSLVVNDSIVDSEVDTVLIDVADFNSKPVADAGEDANVLVDDIVTLDGSGSYDIDYNLLTYSWNMLSRPAGSVAVLSKTDVVNPSFTADAEGTYVFSLRVNDGNITSDYDYVSINAAIENIAPIAEAGDNQNVNRPTTGATDTLVQLDGSLSSDANIKVDLLTYEWVLVSRPAGSLAALSARDIVNPTFKADKDGAYVAQLIAFDGELYSTPDYTTVNAKTDNSAPVAGAGADQEITTPSTVMLNGSASSDADGDMLKYTWVIVSKPVQSTIGLDDNTKVNPSFVADMDGTYTFQLVVNDGVVNSSADTTNVEIRVNNSTPIARISSIANNIKVDDRVVVDGSKSSDNDGDVLTYSWNMVSVPQDSTVSYLSDAGNTSSFTPDKEGTYVVGLNVNDGTIDSPIEYKSIIVLPVNIAPVADAGTDQTVSLNATVDLNASASSDANGDVITYKWTMISSPTGSSATLTDTTIVNPSFVADSVGDYVLELIVNDAELDSPPDYTTVRAN